MIVRANPSAPLLANRAKAPSEYLSFGRVIARPAGFVVTVLNETAETTTIAQVPVDDAFWSFSASGPLRLAPLASVTLTVPYAWTMPLWVLGVGLGFGAVAEVLPRLAMRIGGAGTLQERLASMPVLTGVAFGFVSMYAAGILIA